MQPFGHERVGSDGSFEVLDVEVFVYGEVLGEAGFCSGSAGVDCGRGPIEVAFCPS